MWKRGEKDVSTFRSVRTNVRGRRYVGLSDISGRYGRVEGRDVSRYSTIPADPDRVEGREMSRPFQYFHPVWTKSVFQFEVVYSYFILSTIENMSSMLRIILLILVVSVLTVMSTRISCPIRNKNIKLGLVRPQECTKLSASWTGSWQQCGAKCTRNRVCKVWTFKSGRCNMYSNAKRTCGLTRSKGAGYTAGFSGCQA